MREIFLNSGFYKKILQTALYFSRESDRIEWVSENFLRQEVRYENIYFPVDNFFGLSVEYVSFLWLSKDNRRYLYGKLRQPVKKHLHETAQVCRADEYRARYEQCDQDHNCENLTGMPGPNMVKNNLKINNPFPNEPMAQ